jgi:ribokinase
MGLLDVTIIAGFIVYAVTSGLRARGQASQNLEEYFLAGRSLPGWKAGISMAATLALAGSAPAASILCELGISSSRTVVASCPRLPLRLAAGANADLSADFVSARADAIARARIVLAQLESPLDSVLEAMRLARAAGIRTLLNPAPANAECSRELLAVADVLTPNETEFVTLLSRHAHEEVDADSLVALDDARLHRLCRTLLPRGTVVVTLGAAGAFVSHREDKTRGDTQDHYRVAAEHVETIDTTGAGDAFNGALATAWALTPDAPFANHVRFAARYAALSTEREGAAATMPRRRDVEARFAE